jgi:hypothetical protein
MQTETHDQTFDIVAMSRRVQRRAKGNKALKASAWGGVFVFGVARGGVLGMAIALYAADRAVCTLSGRSLLNRLFGQKRRARFDGRRDAVNEASWQSFPASDPPGQGI